MIIPDSNLPGELIKTHDAQASHNLFTSSAFYITCALLGLIVANLLLTVVLLIQSRKIDEQIKTTIRDIYRRSRSHSLPLGAQPPIPPSRPPRESFPSIHCPNEGHQPSINITGSSNSHDTTFRTDPTMSYSIKGLNGQDFPPCITKKESCLFMDPSEGFNLLAEPFSPSSDDSISSISP